MRTIYFVVFTYLLIFSLGPVVRVFHQNKTIKISDLNPDLKTQIDSIVNTPFGPTLKSNVHYIDNKHFFIKHDRNVQIVNIKTNEVVQQFDYKKDTGKDSFIVKSINGLRNKESLNQSNFNDGWITYAECSIEGLNPSIISHYSATWNVPSPPTQKANQLLYLFIGLGTIEDGLSYIVQPVLQWGVSPAGGGKYWAICNWYVTSNFQFFYDSLIQVSPGTKLQGNVELTSVSENKFTYKSSFTGYDSELLVNNIPRLYDPSVAFEIYNVNGCNEYPMDERLRMSKINIEFQGSVPFSQWYIYKSANGCDQYTTVVNASLENGEIDINFHSPTAIDNFDDFHIYPNPFTDFLHISPARQINNCKIEVYNRLGVLIHTEFHSNPAYEFNLNFQDFPAGLYLIKFSYNISKTYTFRAIKK